MRVMKTAELGFQAVQREIELLGGTHLILKKDGNKRLLSFKAKDGRSYTVATRAKTPGTWQTAITYGKPHIENIHDDHFWVFVDLSYEPPKFYPVPFWWISNDIFRTHEIYLKKHGGHRKNTDASKHHAIPVRRIKAWEGLWNKLGLYKGKS